MSLCISWFKILKNLNWHQVACTVIYKEHLKPCECWKKEEAVLPSILLFYQYLFYFRGCWHATKLFLVLMLIFYCIIFITGHWYNEYTILIKILYLMTSLYKFVSHSCKIDWCFQRLSIRCSYNVEIFFVESYFLTIIFCLIFYYFKSCFSPFFQKALLLISIFY